MDGKTSYSNMKNTTVLIVFWDLGIGGIQSVIRDFILYVKAHHPGVSVILLLKNNRKSHSIDSLGKMGFDQLYYPKIFSKSNRYIRHAYFFIWLAYNYVHLRPDICLTFLDTLSFFLVLLKKCVFWRKTRIILNENILTSGNNKINTHPLWFWNGLTMLLYPHSDAILVPSIAGKQDLISTYRINAAKIRVCVNWTLTKRITHVSKKYDLMYLGRLEKEKNPLALIDLIIELKKTIPRISLCVVGTGSYESEMRARAQSFQLEHNIIFLGYRSDVSKLLSQSRILVMTTMNEGLPIAILEAGMQEVPCVTTNFLGSEEVVIHNKSGIISNSLQDMSASIRILLTNSSTLRKFGENSYKHISSTFGKRALENFTNTVLGV